MPSRIAQNIVRWKCYLLTVPKLNGTASSLIYSTYLGGSGPADDFATAIAADAAGSAYVTGLADTQDFPGTAGSFQPAAGGAFVTKFNPQGTGLVYSTFLTSGFGFAIAVDAQGNATVAGGAGLGFPLQSPIQAQNGGVPPLESDAFITRLNSQGSALLFSTYFGGNQNDTAYGVALDPAGNTYVTGQWGSGWAEFTPGTGLVEQLGYGGVFVLKISPSGTGPQVVPAGVVNAASFVLPPPIGSLATVFGTDLSKINGIVQAAGTPLPTQLAGVSVTVGGVAAPILAVANVNGQEQINFQVPQFNYGRDVRSTGISVNNNGAVSASVVLTDWDAPGIFTTDGVHGAILHADYSPVTASNPAAKGETLLLFGTGFGSLFSDPVPIGSPASAASPSLALQKVKVTVQGITGPIAFAGLAPGFVGLDQINFTVQTNVPSGELDVVASVSTGVGSPSFVASNTVKLFVQ